MSWTRVKRWLQLGRRKSRQENLNMLENEPVHQRAATLSKTAEVLPFVFVKDYGYIPLVVANAAYVIEKNIRTKGLFQTKGTASKAMTKLMATCKSSSLKTVDVHDAVEALKTVLVSLPDPLIPAHVLEAIISVPTKDDSGQFISVLQEFHKCAPNNFAILHFVINLLSKVSQHTAQTGTDVQTLAVIFVLEVIMPLMGDNPETREKVGDRMQRLPFLIKIMETLIKSPDLFKMAAADVNDLTLDNEREQNTVDLASIAKESCKAESAIGSWSSEITYTRPLGTEASRSSRMIKLSDSTSIVNTVLQGPQQAANASAPGKSPGINTLNLKNAEGNILISGQSLSSVAALAPFINSGRNLMVSAADSEGSPGREGTVKISKLKSSPGRKPLRGSCPKTTAITRRQKTRKYYSNKRVAGNVVDEKLSDPSLNSVFGALLQQEDISGWSEDICDPEDAKSILPAAHICPKVTAVESPDSMKRENLTDCDKMADTSNSTQRFLAAQESGTSSGQNPMALTPDNAEPVAATEDSVIQNSLATVNTERQMLTVTRKSIKNPHKSKLSLKKNRKRLGNLKNGSQSNGARCLSTTPLRVGNRDPHLSSEQISKTSVLFSDNTETVSGTTTRGPNDGDSDDYSVTERPTTHQRTPSTSPECENKAGHLTCSSGPGWYVRHPAGPSDLLCDNTAMNSDEASGVRCTRCDNNAQSFASGNQLENPSAKAVEEGSSSARVRNDVQVRKQSPCIQCTPGTIRQTPKDLQQIIIVKVFNYPRRALARARVRTEGNKSSSRTQRPQNGAQQEGSSMESSLENIFLMSLTLFIVSLVMYHLSNSSREEDWSD